MDDLTLAAEFPTPSREQWLRLVEGVLKGADFEKKLVSRTYEGLGIQPLYPKAEETSPIVRTEAAPWRITQRMDHPDLAAANALALADLEGGADSLALVTRKAPSARGFGLAAESVDELDRALSGVMLDLIHIRLDAGGRGRIVAGHFATLAERRGHALSQISADLGLDPIGAMAALGILSAPWPVVAGRLGETLADLTERGFAGRTALADGRPYHEAGAGEAQELAAVLATGVAYLRALEQYGHSLEAARDALSFLLVADADEFLTVAKFRALRRLWARVEQMSDLAPKPIRLHAETAWRMTTRRDPWVNMLRGTIAAFSAGIGGADAVTILPFTAALGLPDAFARRVARNTQLILLHESNLWRVADPAAGAGGFEALTEALCEKAWSAFQDIERDGGIVESLMRGTLQAQIAETQAGRARAVATRREPITGTSEFPNLGEATVEVLLRSPLWDGKPAGQGNATPAEAVHISPLPSLRDAEPFERLRDRSDAALVRTGARPRIFLANLGPLATFTARATFAKNFFEAGGIEAISNDGFANLDQLVGALSASKAQLVCICSSDEIYKEKAVDVAKTLRDSVKGPIYLAGRPGEMEQSLREAGVTDFIYVGCDVLGLLSRALDHAGA
ncbi:methylmalonyl-CoA mutase family protein [Microvirga sp. 17 mud 1-3]|uniref:methylmalonyl-CoA mutase family protein n=1 Tax=Microvirga sp. 17 mud 1-3 TaxID=2082949 RepID=UPI000D6CFC26|nr:methylmalonyl-CoA mutase family protein [Microvirga sp. 17 mud 1-3]AWM89149.1 methylmalonyl-CoA mutase [Microvirga sp. 17 mud 1-3]